MTTVGLNVPGGEYVLSDEKYNPYDYDWSLETAAPVTPDMDSAIWKLHYYLSAFHVLVNDTGEIVGARVREVVDGKCVDRLLDYTQWALLVNQLQETLNYLTQV